MESAGAGAVVLPSLFEEELSAEPASALRTAVASSVAT
jgi:hypothetical protein